MGASTVSASMPLQLPLDETEPFFSHTSGFRPSRFVIVEVVLQKFEVSGHAIHASCAQLRTVIAHHFVFLCNLIL